MTLLNFHNNIHKYGLLIIGILLSHRGQNLSFKLLIFSEIYWEIHMLLFNWYLCKVLKHIGFFCEFVIFEKGKNK